MILALRAPLLCILVVIYIAFFHYRSKHLKTINISIYNVLSFNVLCHLTLGFITEYTVNHHTTFPADINLILHNLFYITVLLNFYMLYIYVLAHIELHEQKIRK